MKHNFKLTVLGVAAVFIVSEPIRADLPTPGSLVLWYTAPATSQKMVNEGLPIGNSRIGGLIQGGVTDERIVLNEDSLWTGDDNPSGDYKKMGSYQIMGDLFIHQPGQATFTGYRRDLDLSQSLAHVVYQSNGVSYEREYFCSQPAGVMVINLTADKPGSYTGSIELKDSHLSNVTTDKNIITMASALANGLKYESQVWAVNQGGTLQVQGNTLSFQGCDRITLFFAAGTDYAMDYAKGYRGDDPHDRVSKTIQAASRQSYDFLKDQHIKDFQGLFNRASLDLGQSSPDQKAKPTDKRKADAVKVFDPELEELLFQYGRYLLISCSRPGGLPANLQGLWNDSNSPEWYSDYHANINVEMNYWSPEVTGIPECHVPFFDLIQSQLIPWRKTTSESKDFNVGGAACSRGWALRTSHNIFGGMGWNWDKRRMHGIASTCGNIMPLAWTRIICKAWLTRSSRKRPTFGRIT